MASNITEDDFSDYIDAFLEEQSYHGKSERTLSAYERVLRDFENHVTIEGDTSDLAEVDRRTCMTWVHGLRGNLAESTIASYASYVNRFYRYMVEIGAFHTNPMQLVMDQMPESIDQDPVRRDIGVEEMRTFVQSINHPLAQVLVVTMLKTGIRVGELCNLDVRDVTIEDIDFPRDDHRGALAGRSNALYVDNTISRNDTVNGERRTASNKRQRATIIPLDEEMQWLIRRWMLIRPDAISTAEPLFLDTGDNWGERLTPESVRYRVRRETSTNGWHRQGASAAENVTPHYFRHFFTTRLRDRTGDRGIVKYLRGDVATDIIDTYTHNWGDRVRRRYESNIYQLLSSP